MDRASDLWVSGYSWRETLLTQPKFPTQSTRETDQAWAELALVRNGVAGRETELSWRLDTEGGTQLPNPDANPLSLSNPNTTRIRPEVPRLHELSLATAPG